MELRTVLITLIFAGVGLCTFTQGPMHTGVKVGEKVKMLCEVSNDDHHFAYWGVTKVGHQDYQQIYYSAKGPKVSWIEVVEGENYNIIVQDGSYNKSGRYKCDYLADDIFSLTAEVMTLSEMDCGESGVNYREGANVGFTCSVLLTGAMDPSLRWYQGDREVIGGKYIEHILLEDLDKLSGENRTEVDKSGVIVLDNVNGAVSPEISRTYFSEEGEDEPPAWHPRKVTFYQNITIDHTANQQTFTCKLHFAEGTLNNPDPPTYTDSCSTTIGVTYGATSIDIKPNPSDWSGARTPDGVMEVKVGDSFTCSARGNPPPMIIWYKIEGGLSISLPEGAVLEVKKEMRGLNSFNCTALNEPHGQEKRAFRAIKFYVGGHEAEAEESKGGGCDHVATSLALILAAFVVSLLNN